MFQANNDQEDHRGRKNEKWPCHYRADVRKGGDNINLKRRKITFAERDEMGFLHFISIQTEPQISFCSPYISICNLVLTKQINSHSSPQLET